MSLSDRLFGRKKGMPQLDLAVLQAHLTEATTRYAGAAIELDLVRARLADRCRDAGIKPLLPDEFNVMAGRLDEEAGRRLALLVSTLDLGGVREALAVLAVRWPLGELVRAAFTGVARETPLLTLPLLRQSPLRVEELARRFLAGLGASVQGESAAVSRQRLERLDYGRLLAEAERAKEAAADRIEHLRRLQEEQEQRRPRRGKW